jgi:hypothetical protein
MFVYSRKIPSSRNFIRYAQLIILSLPCHPTISCRHFMKLNAEIGTEVKVFFFCLDGLASQACGHSK